MQPDVLAIIRTYLAATGRRMQQQGPLFRAHDRAAHKIPRGRLTARAVGYVVTRCTKRAGIHGKQVSPHTGRHTCGIRVLRATKDVVKVNRILGHASLSTTQRYVDHLGLGELREGMPFLPHR